MPDANADTFRALVVNPAQALPQGLNALACSPATLVAAACARIVAAHADQVPDLNACVVLVPDASAIGAVARALRSAAAVPVLLLPRITTLRLWADTVPLERRIMAPAAREALLYRVLSERGWFDRADLWAVAAELAGLFDELTRWQVALPDSLDAFSARLDAAYGTHPGASFAFEARLVHELWQAFGRVAEPLDAEAAYHVRLAELAGRVGQPVYAIGLGRLAPAEEQFLERCATRVPVLRFEPARTPGAADAVGVLAAAWPAGVTENLHERAMRLRAERASSPLSGRLTLFGAAGAEELARAADVAIRRWLLAGCESIGVVVLDRVAARRTRALLERAEVLVRDEVGWPFSTTSAATVVARWLDALGADFYFRDVLDLLKSPFMFRDWPRPAYRQAVWRFERLLRATHARAGLDRYLELAHRAGDAELSQLLARVRRAEQAFQPRRRKSLRGWISALRSALVELGIEIGLQADAAGKQLLGLLDQLARELESDALTLEQMHWRRWLARRLESETFRDRAIDSPVVFTSFGSARLRSFDAVLILGADADHLPGEAAPSLFFNQSVRRDLGLPGRVEYSRDTELALADLIAGCARALVLWQRLRDGEEQLLAPMFERLRALHEIAWGERLDDPELAGALAQGAVLGRDPGPPVSPSVRPAPQALRRLLPSALSASAYNALMACPYQFHARHVLGLAQLDDVQEEVDKADYGSRVHEILAAFHRDCPSVSAIGEAGACAQLDRLSERAFDELIEVDFAAKAWLARWRALIPAYVAWQRLRELDGWRFVAAEDKRELAIVTPAGHRLVLRGRLDRVDARAGGEVAVMDYKTQAAARLRERLRNPGEDVQLPVYALLWGGPVAAALFLSIDRDEVAAIEMAGDLTVLTAAVRERLVATYDAIAQGAPLPAHGAETACAYCEMDGLCRRKHWP